MLSARAAHAADFWEQNIGSEDPRKEAGHGTRKSSKGEVANTGGGRRKWASRPPCLPARRRRVHRSGDRLYARPIRWGGPAHGRSLEPRARRDVSVLRPPVPVGGKGLLDRLDSQ